ncbi:hypothetical protein [Streptomyces sp. NPDC001530]|uniref:hypothetical protein n=1 Tax=Streptomyces sp. NPDC001530 TaxID=3364582 RepID=UPI00368C97A2
MTTDMRALVDRQREAAAEQQLARQKFEQRMAPLAELLAHPETAHGEPASAGELAEYRHLRIDGDPDWTVHPFPDLIKHGRTKGAS